MIFTPSFSWRKFIISIFKLVVKVKGNNFSGWYDGEARITSLSESEVIYARYIDFGEAPEWIKQLGYDPQTSGGLLCSIDKNDAENERTGQNGNATWQLHRNPILPNRGPANFYRVRNRFLQLIQAAT